MQSTLLDLCSCRKNGFQVNPEAMPLMAAFKRSGNLLLRQGGFCKAGSRENSLSLISLNPYRKPTQVISSSRRRRTSEGSPRNSAKKQP